jgi:hypothetical protein
MDKEIVIIEPTHPIFEAIKNIQKARSRFQLEKFVVGQHDTPQQRYKQTLLEIQTLLHTRRIFNLELKKQKIEVARLKATGDEIDAVDAEIKEVNMEQTVLGLLGVELELKDLIMIWESFEHKYTYEELEETQPEYWSARLTRQAQLEALGSDGKVGWASLEALRQVGKLDLNAAIALNTESVKEIQ